jgi:Tol biopolymer transport system component
MRVEIVTTSAPVASQFALSPDGRAIVFIGPSAQGRQIWLRKLDATSARPLPGTEGGEYPFWSPNSRSIGFSRVTTSSRSFALQVPWQRPARCGERRELITSSARVSIDSLK